MGKTLRIAIVDESASARGFIASTLQEQQGMEVIASVPAVDQLFADTKVPDVVFMDVEAETGLKSLQTLAGKIAGVKVVALARNSEAGIKAMVKAMQQGAADCLIKILPEDHAEKSKRFAQDLKDKAAGFSVNGTAAVLEPAAPQKPVTRPVAVADSIAEMAPKAQPLEKELKLSFQPKPLVFVPKALAIASSTGGPKSLVSVFQKLKGRRFNIPVFVTQHMPKDFTQHFAKQLEDAIGIPTQEGVDGEVVMPGHVYVAPGDYHMQAVKNSAGVVVIKLNQEPPENFCRPAADPMIRSLVKSYGGQSVLLVVLTGMGSDGMKGAEVLVKQGGLVLAQDKATSVVWGMPGAVAMAGLVHKLYPLDEIHQGILDYSSGKIA